MGDFAHTMLILLAMQKLAPTLGAVKAASVAAGLYVLHNVLYAGFSMVAGWLADRFDKGRLLASGYFLAGVMAVAAILLPPNLWTLAAVFAIGGIYVAMEETLEDSFCAELVSETHHGMAFGTLATVNGVGDLPRASSLDCCGRASGPRSRLFTAPSCSYAGARWCFVSQRLVTRKVSSRSVEDSLPRFLDRRASDDLLLIPDRRFADSTEGRAELVCQHPEHEAPGEQMVSLNELHGLNFASQLAGLREQFVSSLRYASPEATFTHFIFRELLHARPQIEWPNPVVPALATMDTAPDLAICGYLAELASVARIMDGFSEILRTRRPPHTPQSRVGMVARAG